MSDMFYRMPVPWEGYGHSWKFIYRDDRHGSECTYTCLTCGIVVGFESNSVCVKVGAEFMDDTVWYIHTPCAKVLRNKLMDDVLQ